MNEFIKKHAATWQDNPLSLLEKYDYSQKETMELDALKADSFNRETLYKIILWKLNRLPDFPDDMIEKVKRVSAYKPGEHRKAEGILKELLAMKGIALPTASTILRFLNPKTFQIIDDRAYRVLFSDKKKYAPKPAKVTETYLMNSTELYFEYLDELCRISCERLPFHLADRILYQLDIEMGNKIGD